MSSKYRFEERSIQAWKASMIQAATPIGESAIAYLSLMGFVDCSFPYALLGSYRRASSSANAFSSAVESVGS